MVDSFTPEKRSEIMGRIGGKNTAPERKIRSLLHRLGYRFRLHRKGLPGKPDVVLPRYKTVIFVHGCFWHGHHGCKRAALPTSRQAFWRKKISKNRERDARVLAELVTMGYQTIVVWECELKDLAAVSTRLTRLLPKR